jgi:hypothetical protein
MMVCERRGRARRVGARRAETLRHVEHELQTLRETHAATAADLRSAEAERASLERQLQDTVSGARQALAELQETQRTREEGVAQLRALQLTSDRLRTSVDAAEGQLQQREAELRHREAEMRSVQEQVGGGDQQPPPPPPISTCLCPAAPPRRSPCWCWWRVWPFLPRAVRRPAVLFEQRTRAGPRGGGCGGGRTRRTRRRGRVPSSGSKRWRGHSSSASSGWRRSPRCPAPPRAAPHAACPLCAQRGWESAWCVGVPVQENAGLSQERVSLAERVAEAEEAALAAMREAEAMTEQAQRGAAANEQLRRERGLLEREAATLREQVGGGKAAPPPLPPCLPVWLPGCLARAG